MSYTPHEWQNDELITAAKLNNIEEGIAAGGSGAVIITDNGTQLDKTYAEIYDLVHSGTPCYIKYNLGGSESALDEDYTYYVALMPIVYVFKYELCYRICASASAIETYGEIDFAGMPETWVYQVSVSTGYPTFYQRTHINTNSLVSNANRP